MSETNIPFKVLWVEDQDIFVKPLKIMSKKYGLELDRYTNWQEAQVALEKDFDSYSAIILDAHCKLKPNSPETTFFLPLVRIELEGIFGKKQKYIPWYVFSGQIKNEEMSGSFQTAIMSRERFNGEWGEMLYDKTADKGSDKHHEALFRKIQEVAKTQSNNIVLYRHKDVFKYLGGESLIDGNARQRLLRMLGALYYPEDNIKFEYAGNPLRKVLERLFRAANRKGLLSKGCFDDQNRLILLNASRYLGGETIKCYKGRDVTHKSRWGEDGETVFPKDIAMMVKNILNFSGADSHTEEDEEPYLIEEGNKELFFGYVMQLCHVIKWFGEYIEEHPDKDINQAHEKIIESLPDPDSFKGKSGIVQSDDSELYIELEGYKFKLSYKCKRNVEIGKDATIKSVIQNNKDDSEKYPYFVVSVVKPKGNSIAEEQKSESNGDNNGDNNDDEQNAQTEASAVTIDQLKGETGIVLTERTCLYMTVKGVQCKLKKELNKIATVGLQATIESIVPNGGDDAGDYPFIIEEIVKQESGSKTNIDQTDNE